MIAFSCPYCQTRHDAPDNLAGQTCRCNKCQKPVLVPSVPSVPPAPSVSPQPTPKKPRLSTLSAAVLLAGTLAFMFGCLITLANWAANTTVSGSFGDRIHNEGLMNDRVVGAIVGVGMTLGGLILLVGGGILDRLDSIKRKL